jgi:hypothetical protein
MPRLTGFLWIAPILLLSHSAGRAAELAVDATGCLRVVKTSPSGTCASQSSLQVDLANNCKFRIRAQLCLRGANHLWVACEAKDTLAPKEHFFESSCDSDGDYTYWGCSRFAGSGEKCGGDGLVGKATNTKSK